jgi:type I restriction enzyme S subunit
MSLDTHEGYHKTPVGWIPTEWRFMPINAIAQESTLRNGSDTCRPVILCSKHVGFVRSLDYFKKKIFSDDTSNYKVVKRNWIAYPSNHIEEGSIGIQSICDAGIVSPIYTVFSLNDDVEPDFIHRVLKTELYRQQFVAAMNGSVDRRGSLRWPQFSKIIIPVPPPLEQKKIASILTVVDAKLDVIARQIEATHALKQGLMRTLFSRGVGTQDADGRWVPHAEFKDSELGEVPAEWLVTTLGAICNGSLQTGPFGSQLHADEYQDEGIPVLMPKDLVKCKANLSTAARIAPERAEALAKHKLAVGDLLFSRRGDVARFALIDEISAGALCGTGCLKAKPSGAHSSVFIAHLLQLNVVRAWLEQNAVGQTMPNMNTGILASLPLATPANKQEQEKIAGILDSVDAKAGALLAKQSHFQTLKRGLMQKLLIGEWRVKLDDVPTQSKTLSMN